MEIEFNPGQIPETELSQPAGRQDTTPAALDSTTFSASSSMTASLQDNVDQAMKLASDEHYPPDYVEERIAILLALRIKH
jgi:hypothetical protein